jgi:hypothetical protein
MGYAFCAGPEACIDGADTHTPVTWPPGACLLKSFWRPLGYPTPDGCGGPGQPWRSGFPASYSQQWGFLPAPCGKGGAPPADPVPGVPGGVVDALWDGSVVVLDVDSWQLTQAGPMGLPPVHTAFQCSYECEARYRKAGANAFAFCSAADPKVGCGSGCAAAAKAAAASVHGGRDTHLLGPFLAKGCAEADPDAWAHGLCQCRKVSGKSPGAVPVGLGGGPGWVSGPLVKKPQW